MTIEARKSDDDNQITELDKTDPLFFERDVQLQKQGDSYANIIDWALSLQQHPVVSGTVQDVWNNPIEGAMVQVEGNGNKQTTDAQGRFTFELQDVEAGNLRFRAGHTEFIHDVEVLVYAPEMDAENTDSVEFELYQTK